MPRIDEDSKAQNRNIPMKQLLGEGDGENVPYLRSMETD